MPRVAVPTNDVLGGGTCEKSCLVGHSYEKSLHFAFFPETNPKSQSQFGFGVLLSDEAGNPTLHRVPHRNGSVRTPAPPEEVLFFSLNPPPRGSGLRPPPFIVLDGGVVACQYLFLYSTEEMRVLRHANPQQRARTMHGLEYRVLPGGDGGRAGPHCPEGRVV